MVLTFIYCTFCYGYILAFDDNDKWVFRDYIMFISAPFVVPVLAGKRTAELLHTPKKYIINIDERVNADICQ